MTEGPSRIGRSGLALVLLALVGLALAVPAAGQAREAGAHGAARLRASLSTAGSRPRVNTAWNFKVRASDSGGRPLRARIQFEFWIDGSLKVAEGPRCGSQFKRLHRCINVHKRVRFRGTFSDFLCYTPAAAGTSLQFRVKVRTSKGTRTLRKSVRPRTGPRKETAACKRPTLRQ